ncbi:3'-5' exoribonuclease 1 [Apophysomyces ossiformis]|uniref:3'-5' exoribonuclease 1 n=1 Tax=Apophysomyces ossiformis TaxID=679940 RepID=A0A8H7BVW7_9FUNG|nr:3'-5' exoribonuclease 1 [Apophysomyces ossiformis]
MPTVEEVRQALAELGCDTRGRKYVLKKRLREAKKKQTVKNGKTEVLENESSEQPPAEQFPDTETSIDNPSINVSCLSSKPQPFDYYLFFDVEATCEENAGFDFPNEIIEFPVVLVSGKTFEIVDQVVEWNKS